MRALARLLVRVFFRRIELEHGDDLPAGVRWCWWPTTSTAWSTDSC